MPHYSDGVTAVIGDRIFDVVTQQEGELLGLTENPCMGMARLQDGKLILWTMNRFKKLG